MITLAEKDIQSPCCSPPSTHFGFDLELPSARPVRWQIQQLLPRLSVRRGGLRSSESASRVLVNLVDELIVVTFKRELEKNRAMDALSVKHLPRSTHVDTASEKGIS